MADSRDPSSEEGRAGSAALLAPALRSRVRQIQIRTHRMVNTALAGGYRSTFRGQGLEFEEVRPYQPGDEIRAIDWNVTARTGEPFVKSYREERQLSIQLVVDTSLELDFATFGETKRDAASQVAALLAFVAMRHQDRVGLTLFGTEPGLHLDAAHGTRHVLRLIAEIQSAAAPRAAAGERPRSSLAAALEEQVKTLKKRSLVFLLSDFHSVGSDGLERDARTGVRSADWAQSLARLASRHDVIAVRFVDRFEEELPAVGALRLARMDGGSVGEVDGRKRAQRERWSEDASERAKALGRTFARARAEWVDVRTDGDLAAPLVRLFHQRAQGRGNSGRGNSGRASSGAGAGGSSR